MTTLAIFAVAGLFGIACAVHDVAKELKKIREHLKKKE